MQPVCAAAEPEAEPESPAAEARAGPTHFQVDQTFNVKGVGTVVSGTVIAGHIDTGQNLMLGPTSSGGFVDVIITGIQRAQVLSACLHVHTHASCLACTALARWPVLAAHACYALCSDPCRLVICSC